MSSASPLSVAPIRRRLALDAADPLLRSAYSLMLNVVLTSVLGFGFWIAAARMFSSSTVGRDSALISAMLTLSLICQLNLSSGILRFLPIVKLDPARAVIGAYVLTAALTTLIGALFVVVAPNAAHNYHFLREDSGIAVTYVAAAALWSVFTLQDAVLTALRRAPWVPAENATFGVLKIAALPLLLAVGTGHAIFIAWVIPMAMLVVPVNYLIFAKIIPNWPGPGTESSPVQRFGWRGLRRFLAQEYVAGLFAQAASTMLPVLIVAVLGSSENAYFYIPFTIVSAFDLLFANVAASLTVEGALAETRFPTLARLIVRRFRFMLIAGVAVLVAGASLVLLPFGPRYVQAGAPVLRLLACASAFRAIIVLFGVICRVEGRASRILTIQASIFTMVIGLAIVLGEAQGIEGVALAWLIANGIAGCAAMPRVLRILRSGKALAERDVRLAGS
jgi:O-antigen/teichoic acid export membrane protein